MLHKLGSATLVPATVMFVVGFSVPAWRQGMGLWSLCQGDICVSGFTHNSAPLLHAVLVAECIALFVLVMTACVSIYQEFFRHPSAADNRIVEILATVSGVFGMTGAVLYGVETADIGHLDWAYWVIVGASTLPLLSALLIACTRHRTKQRKPPNNRPSVSMGTLPLRGHDILDGSPQASMMMMPTAGAGTFGTGSLSRGRAPPPYALPPTYPYPVDSGYPYPQSVCMTTTPQITAGESFGMTYPEDRLSPVSVDLQCQGHAVTPQGPTFYSTAHADVVPLYMDSLTRQKMASARASPRLPTFHSNM